MKKNAIVLFFSVLLLVIYYNSTFTKGVLNYGVAYNAQRQEHSIPQIESYFEFDEASSSWYDTNTIQNVHYLKIVNVDHLKNRGKILSEVDYFRNPKSDHSLSVVSVAFISPDYQLDSLVYYLQQPSEKRVRIPRQEALDSLSLWMRN